MFDPEFFVCCICQVDYNFTDRIPKMIPLCGHTLCSDCILKMIDNQNINTLTRMKIDQAFFDAFEEEKIQSEVLAEYDRIEDLSKDFQKRTEGELNLQAQSLIEALQEYKEVGTEIKPMKLIPVRSKPIQNDQRGGLAGLLQNQDMPGRPNNSHFSFPPTTTFSNVSQSLKDTFNQLQRGMQNHAQQQNQPPPRNVKNFVKNPPRISLSQPAMMDSPIQYGRRKIQWRSGMSSISNSPRGIDLNSDSASVNSFRAVEPGEIEVENEGEFSSEESL